MAEYKFTKDQFEKLHPKINNLAFFVSQGSLSGVDYSYLQTLASIHLDIFGGQPVKLNCNYCKSEAIRKIYPLMQQYETQLHAKESN